MIGWLLLLLKMMKLSSQIADQKPENDKARKIYRAAMELVRRLDDLVNYRKALKEVFLPEPLNMRSKLLDYCERLMFYDPKEFGRKAEEFLWRKVFYDVIQLVKMNRKTIKPKSFLESAFHGHLAMATGYYYHLIFKLQSEFSLDLQGALDFHLCHKPFTCHKWLDHNDCKKSEAMSDWAMRACHRCLVYLGDIARYQSEFDNTSCQQDLAQKYYFQAFCLLPEIGMPLNQLGTLAGGKLFSFDAVYYYMRCALSETPFEGADGNLARIFEKNRKRYLDLAQNETDNTVITKEEEDIHRFLVIFVQLVDTFYSADAKMGDKELQNFCQICLQLFNVCMFYQNKGQMDYEKPQNLGAQTVFRIAAVCIMTIYHLQKNGNKQVTTAIAFSLALFSHILNHLIMRLHYSLYQLKSPPRSLPIQKQGITADDSSTDVDETRVKYQANKLSDKSSQQSVSKKSGDSGKPNKIKLRRRRRGLSSSSEDSSQSEAFHPCPHTNDEVDLSEQSGSDDELIYTEALSSCGSHQSDEEETPDRHNLTRSSPRENEVKDKKDSKDEQGVKDNVEVTQTDSVHKDKSLPGHDSPKLEPMRELQVTAMDWDASYLFHQTLELAALLNTARQEDASLTEIVAGKKEVSVPPGFEESKERDAVEEITNKLSSFNIETDTDTAAWLTDTELSAVTTESDTELTDSVPEQQDSVDKETVLSVLNVLQTEDLLSTVKVFCDWLKCHMQITSICAKSAQSLWNRFAVLLNLLPNEMKMSKYGVAQNWSVQMVLEKNMHEGLMQRQPLLEDVHLRGLMALHECHQHLDFNKQARLDIDSLEEVILRVCCLRNFGYCLSKLPNASFKYDPTGATFLGPTFPNQVTESSSNVELKSESTSPASDTAVAEVTTSQSRLMRSMAQLRLQAEVKELEGHLMRGSQQGWPSLPAYLILDTNVLCDHLVLIKQLVHSNRFIVIVPTAVIDQLDYTKRDGAGARDAIRWLESEFHKGNRYVRAQKTHEKIPGVISMKSLKKKDREAWRFIQILDCARYFNQQAQGPETAGRKLVYILSNHNTNLPNMSARLQEVFKMAKDEDFTVQSAILFFNKWKETIKKST